nr:store-operated calcium entry-associated regulatory factor-like [Cherax quadricarinatus]XP_053653309.1 store-operated calcium entry-associated regulatory factor-like [Cherax quadricarinatus]
MKVKKMSAALGLLVLVLFVGAARAAWGTSGESILLKDVEVLTLYNGKMTTGRRSSPVPQLQCVKGGTAPCDAFIPRVVQCYNRGWDGVDVQWECKTDMDNAFRFGEIEVSCEGYSNRDDPFVLKGSCGLRYSIDYTKEGLHQKQGHHNYYGDESGYSHHAYGNSYSTYKTEKSSNASYIADFIVLVAVALMCWVLYKTCFGSSRHVGQDAHSNTNDDYPSGGGGGGYGWFGGAGGSHPSAPPPPEYTDGASCRNRTAGNARGFGGAGGFWTGAATGGLVGYMFGNSGRNHNRGYGQPSSWGWGGGGGGFSGGHHSGGGGGGGGSTGTRGASGFGGTSRR